VAIILAAALALIILACAGAAFLIGRFAPGPGRFPQPTAAAVVRTIRVRIACDEEWRRQAGWEALARGRLARASAVFEQRFGVRWLGTDLVAWSSDDDAGSLEAVADELERTLPLGDADVVLGFSGQMRARGSDREYRLLGWAPYFGRHAIVTTSPRRPPDDWYLGSLVHELGHLLGAWHCADRRSVMEGPGYRLTAEDFDPQAVAVVELMRGLDFARGSAWLDAERRRRIETIYGRAHLDCDPLPYVHARIEAGRRLLRDAGDVEGARAALRKALGEQEACVGPDDPSLVSCLQPLAWANLREPGRDVDEAERLARRSAAIAAATNVWVEPPADCDALLGAVSWERGRHVEAVESLRRAYAARVAAIGTRDPFSVELEKLLRRCEAGTGTMPDTGATK
jgi:hypothetical protein